MPGHTPTLSTVLLITSNVAHWSQTSNIFILLQTPLEDHIKTFIKPHIFSVEDAASLPLHYVLQSICEANHPEIVL